MQSIILESGASPVRCLRARLRPGDCRHSYLKECINQMALKGQLLLIKTVSWQFWDGVDFLKTIYLIHCVRWTPSSPNRGHRRDAAFEHDFTLVIYLTSSVFTVVSQKSIPTQNSFFLFVKSTYKTKRFFISNSTNRQLFCLLVLVRDKLRICGGVDIGQMNLKILCVRKKIADTPSSVGRVRVRRGVTKRDSLFSMNGSMWDVNEFSSSWPAPPGSEWVDLLV